MEFISFAGKYILGFNLGYMVDWRLYVDMGCHQSSSLELLSHVHFGRYTKPTYKRQDQN